MGDNESQNIPPGLREFFKQFGMPNTPGNRRGGHVTGQGSGFFISPDGYAVTNNHVVEKADSVQVTTDDGKIHKAKVIGADPRTDLALIKVDDGTFPYVKLSDQTPRVGDWVLAVGNPFGLGGTVTAGIVSARGRDIGAGPFDDFIQIDAPINPGNSGGALVDSAGAVVGINSAAALASTSGGGQSTPASGIGYAIPIDYARSIATQLIQTGHARHGTLGAQGRTVTDGLQQGAYLEQVVPKGPAARAGLRNGDVIVAADGVSVLTYDQLVVAVTHRNPGDRLSLTYFRGSKQHTATVTLGGS
jgi:serine protease Do